MMTWKLARLKPSTQCPAVSTLVGAITDPLQCIRPLRKIATAKGHWAGSARVPPTTDACARGAGLAVAAFAQGTAASTTAAQALIARRLRCRRLICFL